MNKTKIEWCTRTWNPVTGCWHDCEYCYARKIAKRFNRGFSPWIHYERMNEPINEKKPQTVFVCSMADLFGRWELDETIEKIFKICEKAPQHRYIFLTKNHQRYKDLHNKGILPSRFLKSGVNMWFGMTLTQMDTLSVLPSIPDEYNMFINYEPMLGYLPSGYITTNTKWVIMGAETGNRKGKVIPDKKWIADVIYFCNQLHIPLFMKNSLKEIWGRKLIQQYPWEVV